MRKLYLVKDKSFYKKMLVMMLPVVMQQAINMGVNMLDTMMLGSLGEIQLSASSLANQFYNIFTIFCMGIIGGCSVLASQYWGAGQKDKVRSTFTLAMYLTGGLSTLFALLTWFFPSQIMAIYTPEVPVIEAGVRYLKITAFIYLFHGTALVSAHLMRAVQKAHLGLIVSIVSFFVNLGANYIFIFGKFGAPRMEIAGAALGTLIARLAEFGVTFWFIFLKDKDLSFRPRHLLQVPEAALFRNYIKLGAPVLISDGLLSFGNTAMSMILGRMGSSVVSAYAICAVVDRLCTVIISGVSNASSIITGHTIGQGDKEKAMQQGETFYILSMVFGLFSSLLIFIIGPIMILFYELTPETVVVTNQMMRAFVVIVFFQAIQSVMTKGVLRGGGDTRFLMVADVLFMWLVSIPLGLLAGLILHWPAWATVLCLRADYVIKSGWCVSRLLSGKWIHETGGLRGRKVILEEKK